ncbi:pilus assembly protein [[Clostridium] hylemonae]|uniref:pilus assembly protein n=1 Tax=[Clostridium] hylemonae TaxID=89153 RepID=UPI001FCBDF77|nr:pilus assembly protein [[Clostridium] hylemonae]BDF04974.1 hypothetical protein CE91St63_20360 [[Clostridium] hylemonae]
MIWENVWTIIWSMAGYLFLTLVLPSVCLGKYVAQKERTFRFFCYQCLGNLYINYIVLLLGFLHFVNFASLLFTLVLLPLSLTAVRERKRIAVRYRKWIKVLKELIIGTYGFHVLRARVNSRIRSYLVEKKRLLNGNLLEMILFGLVMAWIVWFYGWYKLHNTAYGHTDEETHLYWIGSLIHGDIFPAGMYPHGVHTLNAALGVLMPLNFVRVYLNFSVLSVILIFAAAYMLFRKCFSNRFAALGGWSLFVLADIFSSVSYVRFQFSFPMEFGLVAAFGMVYALFSYIREKDRKDLILFAACIAWTLMAHFYITILCLIICLCFGLLFAVPILKKKLLLCLAAGGLAGVILACAPYAYGLLNGYKFERSIAWALGIVDTTAVSESGDAPADKKKEGVTAEDIRNQKNAAGLVKELLDAETGYLTANYGTDKKTVRGLMALDAALAAYALFGIILSRRAKLKYLGYLFWAVLWQVCAFLSCTYYLNLPTVIEVKRMATFLTFFTIPLLCLPFEAVFCVLRKAGVKERHAEFLLAFIVLGSVAGLINSGRIKKERYFNITISEGDMRVCLKLCEEHKDNTWTVLSPTNDLSVIRYNGFHYEIVDLLKEIDRGKKRIYIPTPDIYVVTEHHPISFLDDRREIDRSDAASPKNTGEISGVLALQDVDWDVSEDALHGADAPYYFQRNIVMSKLHFWMETIRQIYPNHVSEYYSDEQVTVYKIEQDAYFTLNLSVDYKQLAKESAGEIK